MMPMLPLTTKELDLKYANGSFKSEKQSRYRKDSDNCTKIVIEEEKHPCRGKRYIVWLLTVFVTLRLICYGISYYDEQPTLDVPDTPNQPLPFRNEKPVIGMLTMDTPPDDPDKHLGSLRLAVSYVRFLEHAGARVVPIRGGQSESYYAQMVNWTNGVFMTGGTAEYDSPVGRAAKIVFDLAMKHNQQGDYYPVWGTCWGLEMLAYLVAGKDMAVETDSRNASWPLNFKPDFRDSRMFGSAPQYIVDILSTEPVAMNHHFYSVLAQGYYNTDMVKFFKLLSTNKDRKGVEFVSTLEGRDVPVYAIQWHPEKPLFLWDPTQRISRSDGAIAVGHYMGDFVVEEARKSSHSFPSMAVEAEHVVWNNRYKFKYGRGGYFLEYYYMNPDNS